MRAVGADTETMAVDALPLRAHRPLAALRSLVVRMPVALGATVLVSTIANTAIAWQRATPRYLPDEFLYGQLARSLAHGDGISVLGEPIRFTSLVEPLATAVFWLPDDPAFALRATQAFHALAMSLAVVPVWLIARRLRLRPALAWFAVAATVLSPDLLYVGYTTADALGLTLALAAVAAGLSAIARPRVSAQLVFLALVGIAAGTRIQYAAVLPAIVAAGFMARGDAAQGLTPSTSLQARLSRLPLVNIVLACAAFVVIAAGSGTMGRYSAATSFRPSGPALHWLPSSAVLLTLAAGAALVPGAAAWLVGRHGHSGLQRRAFAHATLALLAFLLAVSALMTVETGSDRFFERYLLIMIPLLALAFSCWVEDGRPGRWIAVAVAVAAVITLARSPLSTFTAAQGAVDSPLLLAVRGFQGTVGVANASALVALVGTIALLAGLWPVFARGRGGIAAAAVASLVLLAAVSIEAHQQDLRLSRDVADSLGTPPDWVDRSGEHTVTLLQTAGSSAPRAMNQVIWNTSVTAGSLLGREAAPLDGASDRVRIADDGRIDSAGRAVLVATSGTRPVWASGRIIAAVPGFDLLAADTPQRLTLLAEGLGDDGWVAARCVLTIWPGATVRFRLWLPPGHPPAKLLVRSQDSARTLTVAPGRARTLERATDTRKPRSYELTSSTPTLLADGRFVAVHADLHRIANRP